MILSGPENTRANVEVALEDAHLPIFPPDHYAIGRKSYQAEGWPHLTPYPMVRMPDKDDPEKASDPPVFAPAPGVDASQQHGFVAVLANDVTALNVAVRVVEPFGWTLRVHHDLPPEPQPDPIVQTFTRMEQRIAELESRLGMSGVTHGA